MEVSRLISTYEAARRLGISVRTLERHRQNKTGPVFLRLGRRVLYSVSELNRWCEENKTV
ncbi:helix-turn-helix domain-containing protein [Sneathiella chungangensis]|uniref:Helix-turn-helix domain-containing protein n=1 Tax=Sneathiella chungangensis TaxID=1418234 RepID=A0A845MN41_9PROT|nr:helix-turn-helix domain-containing protein [Sneathiella chungangensis]